MVLVRAKKNVLISFQIALMRQNCEQIQQNMSKMLFFF